MKPCDEGFSMPSGACARHAFDSSGVSALAQPSATIAISDRSLQIDEVLRQGQQLESQRRWGEARGDYEDALHFFPAESSLERRFESARLHYDLGRRYADRSFRTSLAQTSSDSRLGLVWPRLAEDSGPTMSRRCAGTNCSIAAAPDFEIALAEPAFQSQNLPERDRAAVEPFRREYAA